MITKPAEIKMMEPSKLTDNDNSGVDGDDDGSLR